MNVFTGDQFNSNSMKSIQCIQCQNEYIQLTYFKLQTKMISNWQTDSRSSYLGVTVEILTKKSRKCSKNMHEHLFLCHPNIYGYS